MTARSPGSFEMPDRLADLCAVHAGQRPDGIAVRFGGHDLTWQALHLRSQALAGWLWHDAGVRAGDRVALLLALARIGSILVPLNFRLAPAEWDAVWRDCTPVAVLHDAAWQEAATALAQRHGAASWPVEALGAEGSTLAPEDARTSIQAATTPALLVYTSGTTGTPKGAVHTQGQLLANMGAACAVQQLTPGDTVLTVLPLFHVGGLCIQTLPALAAGATVLLHHRFEPQAMLQALKTADFTTFLIINLIGVFFIALNNAVIGTVFCELFPTRVRASGIGLPYAICVAIFGGTSPLIATYFLKNGQDYLIAAYVMIICAISIVVHLTLTPETRGRSLD